MNTAPRIFALPKYETDLLRAAPKRFERDGHEPIAGVGIYLGRDLIQFFTLEQALKLGNQVADAYERSAKDPRNG
jgi:hypothetical protein